MLFDHQGKIRKYESELHIMQEFFGLRKNMYDLRKEFMLAKLLKDYEKLYNQVRFIQAVISDQIRVKKVPKKQIMKQCKDFGLKTMSELNKILDKFTRVSVEVIPQSDNENEDQGQDEENKQEIEESGISSQEYNYLLSMPIWSLTLERVNALQEEMENKKE